MNYFLQNGLLRLNRIVTQLRFIHKWVIMGNNGELRYTPNIMGKSYAIPWDYGLVGRFNKFFKSSETHFGQYYECMILI
jgi:hypothetical protein